MYAYCSELRSDRDRQGVQGLTCIFSTTAREQMRFHRPIYDTKGDLRPILRHSFLMSTYTALVAILAFFSHFCDVTSFSGNSPSLAKSFLPMPMADERGLRPSRSISLIPFRSPRVPQATIRVAQNAASVISTSSEEAQAIGDTGKPGKVSQALNSAEALSEIWSLISSMEPTKPGSPETRYLLNFPSLDSDQVKVIVSHVQHCQTTANALGLDSFAINTGGAETERSVVIHSLQSEKAQLETDNLPLVDDETVISQTESWMEFMIAPKRGLGLCPFTATFNRGGRPAAPIHYAVADDLSGSAASTYAALWAEASAVLSLPETTRSTSLLLSSSPLWYRGPVDPTGAALSRFLELTRTVSAHQLQLLDLQKHLHLVAFHPQYYQQPDQPPATAHFARRSPYPILNWVRASQIDAAQVALGSGYVFAAQNEQCLAALQPEEWQHMLEQGRWQAPNRVDLNELRVDRRNPNFSLFFPAHFARFWTRNPAEAIPVVVKGVKEMLFKRV